MGKTFTNLTWDDLCDLMCGVPEEEWEDETAEELAEDKDENRNAEDIGRSAV
ncbi:MAG: hypothetical protein IKX20_03000 [Paludibacteraceae bacterium]|nr:hypothetical protein [Paludibacteraceae bacterium]